MFFSIWVWILIFGIVCDIGVVLMLLSLFVEVLIRISLLVNCDGDMILLIMLIVDM